MRHQTGGGKRRGAGRRARAVLALSILVGLATLMPAASLAASAGLKPSEAPLVTVGQHYFDTTSWSSSDNELTKFWRLPPLLTADAITVAWNASTGYHYPELCLTQDVDDYSWAEHVCNGSGRSVVSSSGSARTVIAVNAATSTPFLTFRSECCGSFPYDFTIESIQHAVGVGLTPVTEITPTSTLTGSANLSNGSPVPDGLAFTLSAIWVTPVNKASHSRSYTVASSGGALAFPLNLPISAQGKHVSLTVTRPADPQYLAASSPAIEAVVAKLIPPRKHHRRRHHHHRRRHQHRHHASASASTVAKTNNTKQECLSKLLQPPHDIAAAMVNPHKSEIFIKAFYGDVEGCASWQRLGKFRVQIKQSGQWRDLNGNFWYPADGTDVSDKNGAHGFCFLDFETHDGVREEREHGHWQPARVRFSNFVENVRTRKVVAQGKIKDKLVSYSPGTAASC